MPKNKPPRKRKRKSRFKDHSFSRLAHHKQSGTRLTPPLMALPKMSHSSWADDHMPEMLWAVLLSETLPRDDYLACFRTVVSTCAPWLKKSREEGATPEPPQLVEGGINWTVTLDHTTLAEISEEKFATFIEIPLRHPLGYAALRPLLALASLPGVERWRNALRADADEHDWDTLALAVAATLDHQSEKSTDVRWLKVVTGIVAGKMHVNPDTAKELIDFPNVGEMTKVRPTIRATEVQLRRHPSSAWVPNFWSELFEKTYCVDPSTGHEHAVPPSTISPESVYKTRRGLIERFFEHLNSDRVNARLDSAFGLVLYALSLVHEIGAHRVQRGILGRAALRALVEANVTLKYLAAKDRPDLWSSYRVYGAGQAKLAFLKAQEIDGDLPSFISEETLFSIANEDRWQEFLEIDVGHWSKSNLRTLATECDAKDLYDKYYAWASTFVHAHWGAVRDTNFVTCHNPLHRLHRIPRLLHRSIESVDADVVALTNGMLDILEALFPSEESMPRLSLNDSEQTHPPEESSATGTM